jgi:gephyrin
VFGLPGNPVSSFVCFHLVALPALRKMAGSSDPSLRRVRVTLTQDLGLDPTRPEYHRATVQYSLPPAGYAGPAPEGESALRWWAVSTGNQISSRLLSARSANALLELPQATGRLAAGSEVSALIIDDLQGMPAPDEVPGTRAPA